MSDVNSYVIRVAKMFDGVKMRGPAAITVTDGVISDVDHTGGVPAGHERVVDLGPDCCLLPGLIDSHVHLAFDAGPDPVAALARTSDAELLDHMRNAARSALQAGITTVRDLGDRGYLTVTLAEEFGQQPHLGPHVLPAGPPLTTPDGHCHFFGGEVRGTEALRAAVRERHARGCAVVKIMVSGGNMTPGSVAPHTSQYSLEEVGAVVQEAHRLGLPVAAHAHGVTAIRDAIEAGVDTLEHVTFLTANGSEPQPDLLAAVARSQSFVSLTLGHDPRFPLPDHPAVVSQAKIILGASVDLHRLGAKVVFGSDAGIGSFKPHDVLPYAVAQAVELGIPTLDALASVTSIAAAACRVEDRKGRITVGADADFLAVNGDPEHDPAALRNVEAVFRAGVRVR
ncbi:amidohydrolase family protein [Streptomyces spiralis]